MRRSGWFLGALGLVLAVAAHWGWWYQARPHAMAPADSVLLADAPALPVRVWLPYPHQNLGALGGTIEQPGDVLAAAARLAGVPPPTLPHLAPFGLPPARELLAAASRDGSQAVALVRLYPTAALLTRLAGILARNPWLAGGEVMVHGRPARVAWTGLTWRLEEGLAGGSPPAAPQGVGDRRLALGRVDLGEPVPSLPAGIYTLRREREDLVLRLGPALASGPDPGPLPADLLLLWIRRRPRRTEALLLLDRAAGLLEGAPAAAAWASPEGALQVLPGGELLRHLANVRPSPLGGGEIVGTSEAATVSARALAAHWLPLAAGRSVPPLALGGWLATAPAARRAEQLHRVLAEVPLLGEEQAQRWGDVALVLSAARGYRTLSCWLAADGSRGELRLAR